MKGRKERMNERTKGKDEWKNERKGWMKGRKERMNERTRGKDEWKNERKGRMKGRKEMMNEMTKWTDEEMDKRKGWMKGRKERMNEWMIERNFILLTVRIQHLISHLVLKESVHGYWEGSKIKKFILTRRLMELFSGVQVFSHGDSEVQV